MVRGVVSHTTFRRLSVGCLLLAAAVACTAILAVAQSNAVQLTSVPGKLADGTVLLPNGWRLAPVGKHVALGTLPLNAVVSLDGRYAIVVTSGLMKPALTVIDVATWTVKNIYQIDHAWYGLAWSPDGTKLYVGGAAQNNVQEFAYADGGLTRARTLALPGQSGDTFAGGLAISPDGRTLFVTRVFAMTLSAIDLTTGQVTKTVPLPAEPYTCVVSPDGQTVYVSLWGGARVQGYTADKLLPVVELQTGEHPNAMLFSSDGKRLFVASASSAAVWVFDTFSWDPLEQVSTSLYPQAPPTSTPNSLALSPDGRQLLVANADINAVAVIDVSNGGQSYVDGFIPTGWYPTNAVYSRDGKQIFVLSGKGLASASNPGNGNMDKRLSGWMSAVPTPDRTALADYSRKVLSLTPYTDANRLTNPAIPIGSPIPRTVGASTPIKHVFYVIRENRSYDQVLGDVAEGNGDPSLTLFGRDVTPNGHALAQNFVLFDNFYVDADVSYNGHSYSTAAYATDVIEKLWQANMSNRGVPSLGEGGGFMRNPFGNLTAPPGGYLWDYARRAGVSVRSYGEFTQHLSRSPTGDVVEVESVPGLKGAIAPSFAGWDLDITDSRRVDTWLQEFRQYEANGNLPQLSIIRLPNDHTAGTRAGSPTPRAMVAENDLALGKLVEAISSSSVYWKDSALFIVEDDAQAGPDHVDSHRSVMLLASPFARRSFVDHTFYTTSGVLRTIELILGLPPMSQFDAAATPLYNAFTGTPNLAVYRRSDARVPLDEKNSLTAFGASQSGAMDFSIEDRAPEWLLNEIIWRSVKGAHSQMPPPRRSAFVRPASANADDDDDER
ncbi:MAG TPA: SMP-30/gluconolactonase/LRE family protein [Vicinamibacterales bacterium]|nr:SMP-30/gluconolactonase/LRE family protein [Vicinamibacterales bacterium]